MVNHRLLSNYCALQLERGAASADQMVKHASHDAVHFLTAGSATKLACSGACCPIETEHARAKEVAMDEVGSPLISALKVFLFQCGNPALR